MTSAIDFRTSPVKPVIRETIVSRVKSARAVIPGVALAGAIALVAKLLHGVPGIATFSPMILAISIGIFVRNLVGTPSFAAPGISFSVRRLLRAAIVLLGFQITLTQLAAVGAKGLLIVVGTLVATFAFTLATGRALGVDRKLTELIAAGTSICGASAVVATNSVTGASDEDVAYAIACVTIFGSIAMFVYPVLPHLLHLDGGAYGLWSGASIHEIAQVAAASFQNSQRAGEIATVAKLARVMLLAPVVLALSVGSRLAARGAPGSLARAPLPWFAIGFVAVTAVNSVVTIPSEMRDATITLSTFLLTIALAAMGLETDISKLYAQGLRPAILGALAFLFIAIFSLALIKLMG
ncbi:YeiH family protein [Bradyrhizobium hipponense]|uniref:YeiH family protein n=1 Tax=Bradyrhizobium hipponense TaxID=2605638 RepID=UPI001652B890|nr:YeiH family protein [Bradyrhizobium hipponense]